MVLTNIPYLPVQAAERLRSGNFWKPSLEPGSISTMLVGNLQVDDDCVRAVIWEPAVPNVEYFTNRSSPWKVPSPTEYAVSILRNPNHCHDAKWTQLASCNLVLLCKVFYTSQDPIQIEITKDSLILGWDDDKMNPSWCLELFSGGYGGWHLAGKFLKTLAFPDLKFAGVDWNMNAALQYAITHDASIIPDGLDISEETFYQMDSDLVFVQGIRDVKWLQTMSQIRPSYMTISAPCPPWSSGGLLQGLHDEQGLAFLDAWQIARILQPKLIAVEQVAGFRSHEHYDLMIEIAAWAGYDLIIDQTSDLSTITPTRRTRWLAVFRRHNLATPETPPWVKWPQYLEMNPTSFGCQEQLPLWERQLFEPSQEVARMYMDSALMPGPIRQWSRSEIIQHRVPGPLQKHPTFMAAYGYQHDLPYRHLLSKGLFGVFARQDETFRFFTPWEVLCMHLHVGGALLLKPAKISWQILGNLIALPHAVMTLINLFVIDQPENTYPDSTTIFQQLLAKRVTISTATRMQDDMAWYIGTLPQTQHLQGQLRRLVRQLGLQPDDTDTYVIRFPEGSWWHPLHGLQAPPDPRIAPTQLYAIMLDDYVLKIQANPGDFGTFHLHNVDPAECIRSLWKDQLLPQCTTHTDWADVTFEEENILLVPNASSRIALPDGDGPNNDHHFVVVYDGCQPHVFQSDHEETIGHLRSRFPVLEKELFDHRNRVHDQILVTENIALFTILGEITPQFRSLPATDILVITLQAPCYQLEKILPLWHYAFQEDWQNRHGRSITFQWMGDDACQLVFCPNKHPSTDNVASTPVEILRRIVARRFLDVGLQVMEAECDGLIPLLIKHEDHIVGQLLAEDDWYFEDLYCLIQHAFKPIFEGAAPRIIAYGRPIGGECSAADLLSTRISTPTDENRTILKCHLVNPIRGGGPSLGNKNANRQKIQAQLATLCFEHGLSLPQVTTAVDKLVANVAHPRLHHLLYSRKAWRRSSKPLSTFVNPVVFSYPKALISQDWLILTCRSR